MRIRTYKVIVFLCLMVISNSCSKEDDNTQMQEGNDNATINIPTLVTTEITIGNGTSTSIELNEYSKITFTDKYMVVSSNGEKKQIELENLSHISYKQ